jgi:peptidoglycan glycosyltransferase
VKRIPPERRRRITHRALPTLGALAAVSLVAGVFAGANADSATERAASDFVSAWERGDMRTMHGLLTPAARARYPMRAFRAAYERAAATATLRSIDPEDPEGVHDGEVTIPVVLDTRVFGSLRGDLDVPVSEEHVDWAPRLVFPPEPAANTRHDPLPRRQGAGARPGTGPDLAARGDRGFDRGPDGGGGDRE